MIFTCNFDRRKTKPLICIKFWREACLPSLLFGAELFSLNTTQLNQLGAELFSLNTAQLNQLERCQQWFLKRSSMYHNMHQQNFF